MTGSYRMRWRFQHRTGYSSLERGTVDNQAGIGYTPHLMWRSYPFHRWHSLCDQQTALVQAHSACMRPHHQNIAQVLCTGRIPSLLNLSGFLTRNLSTGRRPDRTASQDTENIQLPQGRNSACAHVDTVGTPVRPWSTSQTDKPDTWIAPGSRWNHASSKLHLQKSIAQVSRVLQSTHPESKHPQLHCRLSM